MGQQSAEQLPHRLDPGHVAGEHEKRGKGHQQPPVHAFQRPRIHNGQRRCDDRQAHRVGDRPQDHPHGQTEQQSVCDGPGLVQRQLPLGHRQHLPGNQKAAQQDQPRGQGKRQQHNGQKLTDRNVIVVEQVQVLGIPEGGQHTA